MMITTVQHGGKYLQKTYATAAVRVNHVASSLSQSDAATPTIDCHYSFVLQWTLRRATANSCTIWVSRTWLDSSALLQNHLRRHCTPHPWRELLCSAQTASLPLPSPSPRRTSEHAAGTTASPSSISMSSSTARPINGRRRSGTSAGRARTGASSWYVWSTLPMHVILLACKIVNGVHRSGTT